MSTNSKFTNFYEIMLSADEAARQTTRTKRSQLVIIDSNFSLKCAWHYWKSLVSLPRFTSQTTSNRLRCPKAWNCIEKHNKVDASDAVELFERKKYDFQLNKYFYFSFRNSLFICWTTLLNCKKFNLQSNITTRAAKKNESRYSAVNCLCIVFYSQLLEQYYEAQLKICSINLISSESFT